ncbi:hypothetical protein GCM10009582_12150 [Arthrobacter flavus]
MVQIGGFFAARFGGLADSDDEGRACGFNDVVGDGAEFIGFHDPFSLGEEPIDEEEVASDNPGNGGDGLGIGEIFRVPGLTEFVPSALQNEMQFILGQWAVFAGEATLL